jgi:hypothetical protein
MYKKWQIYAGMIFQVGILLVISKLATDSLNPLEIFRGESLLLKIVAVVLLLIILMSMLNLLIAGGKMADQRCASCGLPLLGGATLRGTPFKCGFCNRYYHRDCIRAAGGAMLKGCKQPGCPSHHTEFEV